MKTILVGVVGSIVAAMVLWAVAAAWRVAAIGVVFFCAGALIPLLLLLLFRRLVVAPLVALRSHVEGALVARAAVPAAGTDSNLSSVTLRSLVDRCCTIGIDVGRTRINGGVLQHDASDSWLECNEFKEMVALDERPTPDGVHRLLTDFIATTINDVGMHQVDSIGLGFPGEVDPSAGMVISSYGGYDSHDPFMENLAVRLAEVHSIVRALIGETSESHEAVCRRLTEKLYLDNDANCAARGTLAKHHADQSWQDFAVVVIGTGVGAGFVLDRHVYFGSAGAAGEIGHTTIGSLGGGVASHLACACHRDAGVVHWEALVSGGGLVAYLRQRAPELYGRLTGMIDRLPEAKDLFQLVRADTSGAQPMQDAAPYREVMADRNLRELVYEVLTTHADCVAEGLANLINLLNLDHVVLSGGVMDGLMSLHRYRQHLQASLQPRLLESTEKVFAGIDWHFTLRQSAGWQGAALLELDTAYQGRLGRRLLAPGAPG